MLEWFCTRSLWLPVAALYLGFVDVAVPGEYASAGVAVDATSPAVSAAALT